MRYLLLFFLTILPLLAQNMQEQIEQAPIQYMLNTDSDNLLKITELKNYKFEFHTKDFGKRSDTVNKNVGRK